MQSPRATVPIRHADSKAPRIPTPGSSHYPFYKHLLAGGLVWRNDRMNDKREMLCLESFEGEASKIQYFGFNDLTVVARPLPAGSVVEFCGEEAIVVSDDGRWDIEVNLDGTRIRWAWKFEGEECRVISLPDPEPVAKKAERAP